MLRELVTFATDDESKVLRRIAPRAAFATPAATQLVEALLAARLLVSALDERGEATVALAHEALLEFWPRLRAWREQNRELLLVHARLSTAARVWERQQHSADFLLARGKPLADARLLLADGVRLSALEASLVAASERRSRRFELTRAAAIASLAILAVLAGAAAYRATLESDRARIQAATAQRTTDFMVSLFATADPQESRGEAITVREVLDRGVTQIQGGLSGETAVRANLLRAMGQAYNGLGLYPKAHELLIEAVAHAKQSGVATDLLKAQLELASNRYLEGDYKEAAALYGNALEQAAEIDRGKHPAMTRALTGLGDSVHELGQTEQAEKLFRRALAIDLELHGERHADTARSLNSLAGSMYFNARYAEAEPLFRRALAIRRAEFGNQHAMVALSLNNLGSLYFQTGQYAAAVETWAEALPIYSSVFGSEHREVATILNNLGRVELMRGDRAAALEHLNRATAIDRKLLAPGHDDLVLPLNSLAMAKMASADFASAEPLLREALVISRTRQHWLLHQVLCNVAELELHGGNVSAASQALAESRRSLTSQFGDKLNGAEAWRGAVLDSVDASLATHERRFETAEGLLLGALPTLEARFGKRSYYTDQALSRLVHLYGQWGKDHLAEPFRKRLAGPA